MKLSSVRVVLAAFCEQLLVYWIDLFVDFLVTKHGLAAALRSDDATYDALHTYFLDRLMPGLCPAACGGHGFREVRGDLDALRRASGTCASAPTATPTTTPVASSTFSCPGCADRSCSSGCARARTDLYSPGSRAGYGTAQITERRMHCGEVGDDPFGEVFEWVDVTGTALRPGRVGGC